MAADVDRARDALEAGKTDEALVLLWNAFEPARLAGDEDALREIGELARSIPGKEAESLATAVGVQAATATGDPAQPPEQTSERPSAWRVLRVLLPLLVLLLYVAASVAGGRWLPDEDGSLAEEPPAKATVGNDVFLVPLGGTSVLELEELVPAFVDRLDVQVSVLPPAELRPWVLDAPRGQLIGEELLLRLAETYGIVDDRAVVIGVVDGDMYERARPEQPFVVSVRSDDERYGVVSTARVGRGSEATRQERIWRAIAREIRALYLHEEIESAA